MATGIATPAEAYAVFLAAWPAIVEECCAVWGSELHYQAMIYRVLRDAGNVPRGQLGMNVKIWLEGTNTEYFERRDKLKVREYRGGFEPIPDVVIFHEDIKGDWTRRNYLETARCLLLAVEVKVSERQGSRLQPGEIIDDLEKIAAFRKELHYRGTEMVPVMLVIDTAKKAEERMTEYSFEEVRARAWDLHVPLFYCGPDRCVVPEPGIRLGSRYTKAEFMTRLEHQAGLEVVPVAEALFNWAEKHTDKVLWGRGKRWGSFTPVVVVDGYNYNSLGIWTSGHVDVQFQFLQYQPPFDKKEKRLELARRLNEISGIAIPEDDLDGFATLKLDTLRDDDTLAGFLDVIDWANSEMRESGNL